MENAKNNENKYKNGKIYKIIDNTNNNIYIGSTIKKYLCDRLSGHRQSYKRFLKDNNKKCYCSSFEILKNEEYQIILIENYPCNNRDELHSRERYYIELLNCVNINIPNRTIKEWYEINKERIKEYKENWRNENKDKIGIKNKEYQEKNKELIKIKHREKMICNICNIEICKNHKSRHQKSKICIEHYKSDKIKTV